MWRGMPLFGVRRIIGTDFIGFLNGIPEDYTCIATKVVTGQPSTTIIPPNRLIFNDVCRNNFSVIAEMVARFNRIELTGDLVIELV